MTRSNLFISILMLAALAALLSLGTWQVQRLHWKEALIARVNAQLATDPLPVAQALATAADNDAGLDYRPVTFEGTFLPNTVFFEFTTHAGKSGWNIFAPFEVAGSNAAQAQFVLINRGYIPYDQREDWQQIAPHPQGRYQITGLFRTPPEGKPGFLMPDNEPHERIFYWRDIITMAQVAGLESAKVASWYVDEGLPTERYDQGAYPVPGTTLVAFRNNHLQYAVTWYGLALALVGVAAYYIATRRRRSSDENATTASAKGLEK